jgi:protein phosphatase
MKDTVTVDISRVEPKDRDVFLLCSDGLSGMVSDARIEEILTKQPDLEKASQVLIDEANAAGGNDNVTCVLVRFHRN